ncbi:MAG: YqzL family protein [Firmicutes bacterium]|nr:YqzL family protein [Bacillota bacterium]
MNLTPKVVWKIFMATGSVTAYLLYKQLCALTIRTLH